MQARLPRLAKPRRGLSGLGNEALAGEYWHVDWGGGALFEAIKRNDSLTALDLGVLGVHPQRDYWHMDWEGKEHIAPGLGDVVDNMSITDDFSGGRFVCPSKDKTAASVLRAFKRQKAAQDVVSGARVARIRLHGSSTATTSTSGVHPP